MKKIIINLLILSLLNSCAQYIVRGDYLYDKKDDSNVEKNKETIIFDKNNGMFIYKNLNKKIEKIRFNFNTLDGIFRCAALLFLPIVCSSSRQSKNDKIENNEDNLRITINDINNIKYNEILYHFTEEEIKQLKFYIKKNDKIYESKIIMPECKKYNIEKTGCYYDNDIKFEFPIKIKDIGKEGATLIIEYEGVEKEIPFKYQYYLLWI